MTEPIPFWLTLAFAAVTFQLGGIVWGAAIATKVAQRRTVAAPPARPAPRREAARSRQRHVAPQLTAGEPTRWVNLPAPGHGEA